MNGSRLLYKKYFLIIFILLSQNILTNGAITEKVVFGYLPDWIYHDEKHLDIRYDLITHLAVFPFTFDSSGNISYPVGWEWEDVVNNVDDNNVKLIMSVAEFDSNKIRYLFTDTGARVSFLSNLNRVIGEFNFDGINIDFENLYHEDEGDDVIIFMRELSDSVHSQFPNAEISFATSSINWSNHWKLYELAQVCDYLFIMEYGFYGQWSEITGPVSPLIGGYKNLTSSLENDYLQIINDNPSKIILGLPYYGEEWLTKTASPGDSVVLYKGSSFYSRLDSLPTTVEELWSDEYNVSWYRWAENDTTWHQLWIDNANSLSRKFDLINEKNLLGLGIWALGYDYPRTDLWNLIEEKFSGGNDIEDDNFLPNYYILKNNYPNPFNPTTKIQFYIPNSGFISVVVYDMNGEEINTLVSEQMNTGWHEVTWDSKNKNGINVSSGCYIYQLVQGDIVIQRKMMFVK